MDDVWGKYNNFLFECLSRLIGHDEVILQKITIIIVAMLVIGFFAVWVSNIIRGEIGSLSLPFTLPILGSLVFHLRIENQKYWLAIGVPTFLVLFISVFIAKIMSYYFCKKQKLKTRKPTFFERVS